MLVTRLTRLDDVVASTAVEAEEEQGPAEIVDLRESADDAPVIKLVNQIIAQAVEQGASDIHFAPDGTQLRVRFRVDGVLVETTTVPRRMVTGVDLPREDHVRPGHRREAPAPGRPRRADDRRPPRRPARRDAAERPRRGRRHAHPRQGVRRPRARQARVPRRRAAALPARLQPGLRRGARHRPDRLGQVDVALRGARRAQHAREEHHHDRGPGRVRARRASPRSRSTRRPA